MKNASLMAVLTPEPAIRAWVFLREKVSIRYIALLAGEDVRTLCRRMRRLGIVCTVDRAVAFADAQRVLLTYGVQAGPAEPKQSCSSERAGCALVSVRSPSAARR